MKKIALILSVLALCACAGGGSGDNTSAPASQNDTPVVPGDTTNGGNQGDNTTDVPTDTPVDILNPDMLENLGSANRIQLNTMFDELTFDFDVAGNIVGINLDEVPVKRIGTTNRFVADSPIWFYDFVVCLTPENCRGYSLDTLDRKYEDRTELAALVRTELQSHNIEESIIDNVCSRVTSDPNFGEWGSSDFAGTFNTLGKANGLRYSDFGHYTIEEADYNFVYQGGIGNKKIDRNLIAQMSPIQFHGSAVAQLQHNYEENGVDLWDNEEGDGHGNRLISTNPGAATLTVDNNTETMTVPFNDWYTVNVTKSGNHVRAINFTNGDNIPDDWKLRNETVEYTDNSYVDHHGVDRSHKDLRDGDSYGGELETSMMTNYYGDASVPSEATGTVHHVEEINTHENGDNIERTIWFDIVFGGTKTE